MEYVGTPRTIPVPRDGRSGLVALARQLDWLLVGGVGVLVAYGLWLVAGVTRFDVPANEGYYVVRQAVYAGIGAVGLACAALINPAVFRRLWLPLYWLTLALMVIVFVAAPLTRGSRRWLDVGFFRFQPSEFGKLLLVLFLAAFLAERFKRINEAGTVLATIGLAIPPIFLVFIQPDFGSALVYVAGLAAVLFVAGARWLHVGVLGAATIVLALCVLWIFPAAGVPVLKEYQQKRITGFLDPDHDPQGATYNITQSKIAVGSGGLTGRGPGEATQTNLNYLPEHATDFAFASLAEQRGFLGAGFLLLLYLLIVWRGLKIVAVARDPFSAIAAGGIVFAFLFQVFVNIGMTIGVAPVTGIPLPFVSVGGSAMVANLLAVGVLQGIHMRGRATRRGGLLGL